MSLIDHTPTRRAFAGLLAATSATGALSTASFASEASNSDAALCEMVDALGRAQERVEKFDDLTDQAMDQCDYPDIPDDLRFRPSDYPHICFNPESCCAIYRLSDDKFHLVYEDEKALTLWAQAYWTIGEAYGNKQFSEADRKRTREIKTAYELYRADMRAAEDAAGVTGPSQLGDREASIVDELLRQIAATPAQTLEGILAKGRASTFIYKSRADLERRLSSLLEKPTLEFCDKPEIVSVSLMLDAVRLGSAECPASRTQAAA